MGPPLLSPLTRALLRTLRTSQAIRHPRCPLPTLDVYLASFHRIMPNTRLRRQYNSSNGSSSLHKQCLPSRRRSRLRRQT